MFITLAAVTLCLFPPAPGWIETRDGDDCDDQSFCQPMGHWPGGQGNCIKDLCMCWLGSDPCVEDKKCCSGYCVDGHCQKGDFGDVCSTDDHCQSPFTCFKATKNLNAKMSLLGTCEVTVKAELSDMFSPCDAATNCAPVGSWPGGNKNCYHNLCDCRLKEECQFDHQCCSGKCNDRKCALGIPGDVCMFDTCAPHHKCAMPSYNKNVAAFFPGYGVGSCEDYYDGPLATHPYPRLVFGSDCVKVEGFEPNCAPFGHWPGGNNCRFGKCMCMAFDDKCDSDSDCCSGLCSPRGSTCVESLMGDLCEDAYGQVRSPFCRDDRVVGRNPDQIYEIRLVCQIKLDKNSQVRPATDWDITMDHKWQGVCRPNLIQEVVSFGMSCEPFMICQPVGRWLGGIGNCLDHLCDCRVFEHCDKDRGCCSGKCNNGTCQPGTLGDVCLENSCSDEYHCLIPPLDQNLIHPVAKPLGKGICSVKSPYGTACDDRTHCAPIGRWGGKIGSSSCLNNICKCSIDDCKVHQECCSGICSNFNYTGWGSCALGWPKDVCEGDSCRDGLTCLKDTKLSEIVGKEMKVCQIP